MPEYSFICRDCDNSFSLFMSYKQYDSGRYCCDKCRSIAIFRDYSKDVASVCGSIKKADSELKTIGDLANRNRDRLSDDQKQELDKKHNLYKEEQPTKQLPKGMNRMQRPKKKLKWT